MLSFKKNSNVYQPFNLLTSDDYYINSSTFIGFKITSNEPYGSCILCAGSEANLYVSESVFLGNSNIALHIVRCADSFIHKCCFSRNTSPYSPDLYFYNKYNANRKFKISMISLYASSATASDAHGFAVGVLEEANINYVNQSFCNVKSYTYSVWMIHVNSGQINYNYIFSFSNTHGSLFSSTSSKTSLAAINYNYFCCVNDVVNSLISSNDARFLFTNSIFIFNQTVVAGNTNNVNFHNSCVSNINIISSLSTNPKITGIYKIADYCFNYSLIKDSHTNISKILAMHLLLFRNMPQENLEDDSHKRCDNSKRYHIGSLSDMNLSGD